MKVIQTSDGKAPRWVLKASIHHTASPRGSVGRWRKMKFLGSRDCQALFKELSSLEQIGLFMYFGQSKCNSRASDDRLKATLQEVGPTLMRYCREGNPLVLLMQRRRGQSRCAYHESDWTRHIVRIGAMFLGGLSCRHGMIFSASISYSKKARITRPASNLLDLLSHKVRREG